MKLRFADTCGSKFQDLLDMMPMTRVVNSYRQFWGPWNPPL